MGRPRIKEKKDLIDISTRLPLASYDWLCLKSIRTSVSMAELLREFVSDAMKKESYSREAHFNAIESAGKQSSSN